MKGFTKTEHGLIEDSAHAYDGSDAANADRAAVKAAGYIYGGSNGLTKKEEQARNYGLSWLRGDLAMRASSYDTAEAELRWRESPWYG